MLIILLVLMIVGPWGILYFDNRTDRTVEYQKDMLVSLGSFSKTMVFIQYYGTQVLKGQSELQTDYDDEMNHFYKLSSRVYHILGDPQPTLRSAYSNV